MYIYRNRTKNAKNAKYPMGILWVWYGYPMVNPHERVVNESVRVRN